MLDNDLLSKLVNHVKDLCEIFHDIYTTDSSIVDGA